MKAKLLAALEADLDDGLGVLFGRGEHGLAFADVVGQRLFAVDVQPLVEGRDELQGVPVRRRGDNDGLEAGDGEQLAIVLEGLRTLVLSLFDFVGGLRRWSLSTSHRAMTSTPPVLKAASTSTMPYHPQPMRPSLRGAAGLSAARRRPDIAAAPATAVPRNCLRLSDSIVRLLIVPFVHEP